ncbi:hypothetical protein QN374_08620, partial [Herbaspirillum sp. RTI4]|uniref:hypothetical protein n=1 Tax=Herbaspirillum sp. RTI4 TaxID=3048640 RepID=UPI002B2363D3
NTRQNFRFQPRKTDIAALSWPWQIDAHDADSFDTVEVCYMLFVTCVISSAMTFFGYKIWKTFKFKF